MSSFLGPQYIIQRLGPQALWAGWDLLDFRNFSWLKIAKWLNASNRISRAYLDPRTKLPPTISARIARCPRLSCAPRSPLRPILPRQPRGPNGASGALRSWLAPRPDGPRVPFGALSARISRGPGIPVGARAPVGSRVARGPRGALDALLS